MGFFLLGIGKVFLVMGYGLWGVEMSGWVGIDEGCNGMGWMVMVTIGWCDGRMCACRCVGLSTMVSRICF